MRNFANINAAIIDFCEFTGANSRELALVYRTNPIEVRLVTEGRTLSLTRYLPKEVPWSSQIHNWDQFVTDGYSGILSLVTNASLTRYIDITVRKLT